MEYIKLKKLSRNSFKKTFLAVKWTRLELRNEAEIWAEDVNLGSLSIMVLKGQG